MCIHLSWTRATMEQAAQDDARTPASVSPPPPAFSTTESPPPTKEYREPLQEPQAPETRSTDGPHPNTSPSQSTHTQHFCLWCHEQHTDKKPTPRVPTLNHIVPEDLQDSPAFHPL